MHYFSLLGEDHVYIYILELVACTCCQYDDSPSCSAHPKEILRAACTNQHQVGYGAWLLWFKKLPILAESHQPIHKIDVSIHIYIYIHIHTYIHIYIHVYEYVMMYLKTNIHTPMMFGFPAWDGCHICSPEMATDNRPIRQFTYHTLQFSMSG